MAQFRNNRAFRDIYIWRKSMELVKIVYDLVRKLPKSEIYGLSDQMRRAAVSIPSNIAEGYGRSSQGDLIHFLNIAQGSKYELETQLEICIMLNYLQPEQAEPAFILCDEIGRMTNAFIMSKRKKE